MPHHALLWWLRSLFTTSSMRWKAAEYELSGQAVRDERGGDSSQPFKQRLLGCAVSDVGRTPVGLDGIILSMPR